MKDPVIFGSGALGQLPEVLGELDTESLFLVTGRASFQASGAADAIEGLSRDFTIEQFSEFQANPQLADVERGVQQFRQSGCQLLVAVGGGSVIDMAKLIGLLSVQQASPRDIIVADTAVDRPSPPLIAIPTTAGSGSEATHFAVVYVDGQKYSLADDSLLPTCSIVDPALTESMPSYQTAVTGLDALCQAVESMWSVGATDASRQYSVEAIQLVLEHLADAVHRPQPANRTGMSLAANLAGKAINITKTTAPHAISYTMTSQFGVPHGHAVAVLLGPVMSYNAEVTADDVVDPRGVESVQKTMQQLCDLFECADAEAACDRIRALITSLGLPASLTELGICSSQDLHKICDNVNLQRLANNPRRLDADSLSAVIQKAA